MTQMHRLQCLSFRKPKNEMINTLDVPKNSQMNISWYKLTLLHP